MPIPSSSHAVRLVLDEFSRVSLEDEAERQLLSPADVVRIAASYYLAELPSERLARRVPPFAAILATRRRPELLVELDPPDRDALELEAVRQALPLARLLEHALLYYLADLGS